MESVLKNIQDPAWWFTLFTGTIFAAFLAPYLRTIVEKLLALISQRYNARKKLKDAKTNALINLISQNPTWIVIQALIAVKYRLYIVLGLTNYIIVTSVLLISQFQSPLLKTCLIIFDAGLAVLSAFYINKVIGLSNIFRKAYKIYSNEQQAKIKQTETPKG